MAVASVYDDQLIMIVLLIDAAKVKLNPIIVPLAAQSDPTELRIFTHDRLIRYCFSKKDKISAAIHSLLLLF